ncbi:hypothetical protein SDC9_166160 [bioreactor metagenome]|uniref:Uncharacterized protein n=1 Tax=bioreactor metagenome TaxID=1076179 RepID=A0A645FWF4_9ZZZZ
MRQPVFPDQPAYRFAEVRVVNIAPRDVDRYGDDGQPRVEPAALKAADLFPDIFVHLADKAVSLKDRNEFSGGDQPLHRVQPANECFGSVQGL